LRGGAFVAHAATTLQFTAESFCSHYKFFLEYFPGTPWRNIPETRIRGKASERRLYDLMTSLEEQKGFLVMDAESQWDPTTQKTLDQFLSFGTARHLVPFRGLLNLNYTDTAIFEELNTWLKAERAKRNILEGLVIKPGMRAQEGAGPKAKVRTDLKRLTAMRLMHAMPLQKAIEMECRTRKNTEEIGLWGNTSVPEVWQQGRLKCRELLQKYFTEVGPDELPLRFPVFQRKKA